MLIPCKISQKKRRGYRPRGADADLVALVELALRVVGGDGVATRGGLERAYGEVVAHEVLARESAVGCVLSQRPHKVSDTL